MPNEPISGLATLTTYSTADLIEVVDVSDATMSATGTNKKVTVGNFVANISQATGTDIVPTTIGFTNSALGTASQFSHDQSNRWVNVAGYPLTYVSYFGHWFFGSTWTPAYAPTLTTNRDPTPNPPSAGGLPFAPGYTADVMIVGTGRVGTGQLGLQTSSGQTADILACFSSDGNTTLAKITAAGIFTGDGSGLINLNAGNLSGSIFSSRLPTTGLTITQHSGIIATPALSSSGTWSYVQGASASGTSNYESTLHMTLTAAVQASDLIIVNVVLTYTGSPSVIVHDNVNSGNYAEISPSGNSVELRTFAIYNTSAVSANTLQITVVASGYSIGPLMSIKSDVFRFSLGSTYAIDSSGAFNGGETGSTSVSLPSPLAVTGSGPDLIYACSQIMTNQNGVISNGPGFTLSQTVPGTAYAFGIASEYILNETSSDIVVSMTDSQSDLTSINGFAFKASSSVVTSVVIDWSLSDWFIPGILSSSPITIIFTNVTVGQGINLILTQGTGGQNVNWPTGITWTGGSIPTLSSGAGNRDQFFLKCISINTYLGYIVAQGF